MKNLKEKMDANRFKQELVSMRKQILHALECREYDECKKAHRCCYF